MRSVSPTWQTPHRGRIIGRPARRSAGRLFIGRNVYAIVKSDSFSRQAKEVMDDAKTRAAELPDELIGLVRQTAERSSTYNGSTQSRPAGTQKKRTAAQRRSVARKPATAKR